MKQCVLIFFTNSHISDLNPRVNISLADKIFPLHFQTCLHVKRAWPTDSHVDEHKEQSAEVRTLCLNNPTATGRALLKARQANILILLISKFRFQNLSHQEFWVVLEEELPWSSIDLANQYPNFTVKLPFAVWCQISRSFLGKRLRGVDKILSTSFYEKSCLNKFTSHCLWGVIRSET